MTTVADLIKILQELPQDAPILLETVHSEYMDHLEITNMEVLKGNGHGSVGNTVYAVLSMCKHPDAVNSEYLVKAE